MSLSSEKLAMFREVYNDSVKHGCEISGLVFYQDDEWRLASMHYGDTDQVIVPDPHIDLEKFAQAKIVRYHTHVPVGGQICMPPSLDDWLTLSLGEKALVITREGVYKFYMGKAELIYQSSDVDDKLRKVHRGIISIADYRSYVSRLGFRFEFYSFSA